MPRGDGTGPMGQGQGGGRGGGGQGGFGGGGGGRRGGKVAGGPGGICVCTNCGKTLPHKRGVPCFEVKCPDCGCTMIRKS